MRYFNFGVQTGAVLPALPFSSASWMLPRPSFETAGVMSRANNLVVKADAPPPWKDMYKNIPSINIYLNIIAQVQVYFATLENCVDFIAADSEKGLQSELVGKRVGVKEGIRARDGLAAADT
jgi:hypothetical protein